MVIQSNYYMLKFKIASIFCRCTGISCRKFRKVLFAVCAWTKKFQPHCAPVVTWCVVRSALID